MDRKSPRTVCGSVQCLLRFFLSSSQTWGNAFHGAQAGLDEIVNIRGRDSEKSLPGHKILYTRIYIPSRLKGNLRDNCSYF